MNEIYIRRSVRKFLDKNVEPEKITKMLEAAMQAPSARNQQPWRFLVIDSETELNEIKKMINSTPPLQTAKVIIVIAHLNELPVLNKVQQDLGCAAQNMMLEAVTQGLGTIWIGTFPNEDRVADVIKLTNMPKGMTPYAVFGVGYPDGDINRFVNRFDESKISYNKWK